jgi:c-di-GMP-binding flagellar brake protein YcgR
MTGYYLILFPLQISATDFSWNSKPNTSPKDLIIVFVIVVVVVGILLIINSRKAPVKGGKKGAPSSPGGGGSFFSVFTLHRIARNLGLDNEQSKMLDYVFKTDQVADPQKSINTPDLLDRHFRRAFRILDQVQGHEIETQRKLGVLFSTRNILENSMLSGMTSTRQIKDETNFTIVANKDKIDVHLISAKGDYLDVEAPKNVLGSQIKIQRGTRLNVLFFNKSNKGFAFETRVIGYSSKQSHPTMQLAHSNQLRFLSQRRFRRRQASINCSLFLVIIEGSGKKQRLIADKRKLQGNIADISMGGCSIKMMSPVQVGARFKIEFLLSDMNLAALGQVLRTNRAGGNTIIHIKFLKASQKTMNLINSYVYEYSRE